VNAVILPGPRRGAAAAPASKSMTHRALICAALSKQESVIHCGCLSQDLAATARCLNALGAHIRYEDGRLLVDPILRINPKADLLCGESGSTLRFLLPLAGALGTEAYFHMEGRLSHRPMDAFEDALAARGMRFQQKGNSLHCYGRLKSGSFTLPGNVSSQYFSGLMMALPLLSGDSRIGIEGRLESGGYVNMTIAVLKDAGVAIEKNGRAFWVRGNQQYSAPASRIIEGDYSAASVFLAAGALSDEGITVRNLFPQTSQGDACIVEMLRALGADVEQGKDAVKVKAGRLQGRTMDASGNPDLMPVICILGALAQGETRITHAQRLRYKESDRIAGMVQLIRDLGGQARETEDGLVIRGQEKLTGGRVRTQRDHRLAMAATVAAAKCIEPIVIEDAECVEKSYPQFWRDFEGLEIEV